MEEEKSASNLSRLSGKQPLGLSKQNKIAASHDNFHNPGLQSATSSKTILAPQTKTLTR